MRCSPTALATYPIHSYYLHSIFSSPVDCHHNFSQIVQWILFLPSALVVVLYHCLFRMRLLGPLPLPPTSFLSHPVSHSFLYPGFLALTFCSLTLRLLSVFSLEIDSKSKTNQQQLHYYDYGIFFFFPKGEPRSVLRKHFPV